VQRVMRFEWPRGSVTCAPRPTKPPPGIRARGGGAAAAGGDCRYGVGSGGGGGAGDGEGKGKRGISVRRAPPRDSAAVRV